MTKRFHRPRAVRPETLMRPKPFKRPSPLWPAGSDEPDWEECERVACQALELPYYKDAESQHGEHIYHRVGTFKIADSEVAIEAVVHEFLRQGLDEEPFYTYREYLDAIKRVGQIKTQLDRIERFWEEEAERSRVYDIRHSEWLESEGGTAPIWQNKMPPSSPEARDIRFAQWYSIDMHTPDVAGYLQYLGKADRALRLLLRRELPVLLEEDPGKPHAYVLGATRSGKTELLKLMIHTFVTNPQYGSVVVIDPSSDFAGQVAHWKEFVGNDRLIYVRPKLAKGMTPRINPFQISGVEPEDFSEEALDIKRVVAQELVDGLERVVSDGSASSRFSTPMQSVLMPCVLTLLDWRSPTGARGDLADLKRFMRNEDNGDLVEFGKTLTHHKHVASYFEQGFYDEGTKTTKLSIYRKINTLLLNGTFANMTCGENTFDLQAAIDSKKVIVFDFGKGAIGKKEGKALGRLVIAMILGIIMRRVSIPKNRRVPCSLIVDECHNYVTENMEEILGEAGKYRLFLTLAQQYAGYQMSANLTDMVRLNTSFQFSGSVAAGAAKPNAELFKIDPEAISRLRQGEFVVRAGRSAPVFKFRTRTELLDKRNSMSQPAWRRLVDRQVRDHFHPVDEDGSPAPSDPEGKVSGKRQYGERLV